ncbi:glycosyl hydrolase family 95 catalytic domain-containing protein [Flagellimonas sp.]|uniref:glycosyl hydrolase family 95 catalytic domain-containing protein n=1 Tax=Flagellimonas sp. TaxID=2058762 RepID=UPI003B52869C
MNEMRFMAIIVGAALVSCNSEKQLDIASVFDQSPEHGFVSHKPASKWEESAISGNGTLGILIPGNPHKDRMVISHEKLFMPEYPPYDAPNLGGRLNEIRELVLEGKEQEASMIAVEEGVKIGIEDEFIWTNPHIPACQLELENLNPTKDDLYARKVNYETGEITINYGLENEVISRRAFVSRPDSVAVLHIQSLTAGKLNYKFNLNQLPLPEAEEEEDAFDPSEFVSKLDIKAQSDYLSYETTFEREWEGSLKSYTVVSKIIPRNGSLEVDGNSIQVLDADEILVLSMVKLNYVKPSDSQTDVLRKKLDALGASYEALLEPHAKVHGAMFNRFSFQLGETDRRNITSEALLGSSTFEFTNSELVVQTVEASRYNVICSTGETPPALQGIWGGTWRPAWSGDFTLNGNVPSVIASGLNTNLQELTDSYLQMMDDMLADFEKNAKGLYGLDGIYVPSRASEFGSVYHYSEYFPHIYWYAGTAWAAHFHYDKWLYTMDENYLKEQALPFMLKAYKFLSQILYRSADGQYMFVPSYSPEVGPLEKHPVAINATMDVASMKQLLRNLITLANQGYIPIQNVNEYQSILDNLPDYAIDDHGELKEWIWASYDNNNEHRHASHLYPLYDGVDEDFKNNPELFDAAKKAIEARMEYRRGREGGEMAFGLVQLGMAASHLKDSELAYECIRWLVNSYWTPSFVSYHDPQEIFNLDISGGMPAVVSYMLLQSTTEEIILLPALPKEWPNGKVKGLPARGGFVVDMEWQNGKPTHLNISSKTGNATQIMYGDQTWDVQIEKGESRALTLD